MAESPCRQQVRHTNPGTDGARAPAQVRPLPPELGVAAAVPRHGFLAEFLDGRHEQP